jgi:hypothetical protein
MDAMKVVLRLAALYLCSNIGFAYADEGFDACVSVYRDSTRNLNQSFKEQSEIQTYFNQHCEKNGEIKTSSAGLNLEAVVYAIPFKFGASSNSAKEKMQEFCKTASSYEFNQSAEFQSSNQVVVDALSNFNQCLAIAGQNLIITHTLQHPESVTISGRWKTAVTKGVKLNQVLYDNSKLQCTSTTLTKDGKVVKVNDQRSWEIPEGFSLSCVRKSKISGGAAVFERATIGLSTTLGDYSFVLQADKLNDFTLSSQAEASYNQLKSDYDTLLGQYQQSTVDLQNSKAAYNRKDSYSVIFYMGNSLDPWKAQLWNANPRNFEAIGGDKNEIQRLKGLKTACAEGYTGEMANFFLNYNGGSTGNTFYEVICRRP